MKKLFKNALVNNNLTANEIEGYRKPLLEGKTNSLYTFFSSTCHNVPNYKETLKNLTIPTMVIWGKHDDMLQWTPIAEEVVTDLNIKPENIHIIDAKHYIQEEKTSEILELILKFVR